MVRHPLNQTSLVVLFQWLSLFVIILQKTNLRLFLTNIWALSHDSESTERKNEDLLKDKSTKKKNIFIR